MSPASTAVVKSLGFRPGPGRVGGAHHRPPGEPLTTHAPTRTPSSRELRASELVREIHATREGYSTSAPLRQRRS